MLSPEKITLFELNQRVKEALALSFKTQYWVISEISEIKENSSGHCYLELVQKDELKDSPKAKARATIWAYTYRMLKPYFETSTGRSLSSGMKVLVSVEVVFHEVFGYSLNITDIEPSFTLGDIEQKRREAIEKLIAEGVFDMNKSLELPILPKRVAIVSSPTAAGLQDFVNQLQTNENNYKVEHALFSANMQGSGAEESIISALNQIYNNQNEFDLVVIIRGGGSQSDLSCFDNYWLAAHVAQFPLPIITGIGHDKDISVVDLVAHTKLKTPTAVAEFIIAKFFEAEAIANDLKERLEIILEEKFLAHKLRFEKALTSLAPHILQSTSKERITLERIQKGVSIAANQYQSNKKINLKLINQISLQNIHRYIDLQNNLIEKLDNKNTSLDPRNILKRGFSITYFNGKILKNSDDVKKGNVIKTLLNKGEIESTVS